MMKVTVAAVPQNLIRSQFLRNVEKRTKIWLLNQKSRLELSSKSSRTSSSSDEDEIDAEESNSEEREKDTSIAERMEGNSDKLEDERDELEEFSDVGKNSNRLRPLMVSAKYKYRSKSS